MSLPRSANSSARAMRGSSSIRRIDTMTQRIAGHYGGLLTTGDSAADELNRRIRELTFLERIVRISSSDEDYSTMLHAIIEETVVATETQVCSLYLWDANEKALILAATNGLSPLAVGQV